MARGSALPYHLKILKHAFCVFCGCRFRAYAYPCCVPEKAPVVLRKILQRQVTRVTNNIAEALKGKLQHTCQDRCKCCIVDGGNLAPPELPRYCTSRKTTCNSQKIGRGRLYVPGSRTYQSMITRKLDTQSGAGFSSINSISAYLSAFDPAWGTIVEFRVSRAWGLLN